MRILEHFMYVHSDVALRFFILLRFCMFAFTFVFFFCLLHLISLDRFHLSLCRLSVS